MGLGLLNRCCLLPLSPRSCTIFGTSLMSMIECWTPSCCSRCVHHAAIFCFQCKHGRCRPECLVCAELVNLGGAFLLSRQPAKEVARRLSMRSAHVGIGHHASSPVNALYNSKKCTGSRWPWIYMSCKSDAQGLCLCPSC